MNTHLLYLIKRKLFSFTFLFVLMNIVHAKRWRHEFAINLKPDRLGTYSDYQFALSIFPISEQNRRKQS